MVGDRKFDIEGSKASGIDSIGVTYGYGGYEELQKAGATYLVSSVNELGTLLANAKPVIWYKQIWEILSPLMLFWLVNYVGMTIAFYGIKLGYYRLSGIMLEDNYMETHGKLNVIINGIGAISTLPFMYLLFKKVKRDFPIRIHKCEMKKEKVIQQILLLCITGASAAICLNILLANIDFSIFLDEYGKVVNAQYSISIVSGIILYGVITPLAEELIFRGILYSKVKMYYGRVSGILISSFFFGVYHGNVVQFLYAFLMGLILAYVYQKYERLYAPVLVHGAANIGIFVITSKPHLESLVSTIPNCLIFGIIMIISLVFIRNEKKIIKI